jgi:hypothetical protein
MDEPALKFTLVTGGVVYYPLNAAGPGQESLPGNTAARLFAESDSPFDNEWLRMPDGTLLNRAHVMTVEVVNVD